MGYDLNDQGEIGMLLNNNMLYTLISLINN